MGGMIAQTLPRAIASWVRSLVSIMSNTGSRFSGQPAAALYRPLLTPAPREREAFLEHVERLFTLIGSPGRADLEDLRELAGLSYDRGRDPAATARQLAAILASGQPHPRAAPDHGAHPRHARHADRLVRPSGGQATARAIPGARLLRIEGMGHDLPRAFWPRIVDAIAENAQLRSAPWRSSRSARSARCALARLEPRLEQQGRRRPPRSRSSRRRRPCRTVGGLREQGRSRSARYGRSSPPGGSRVKVSAASSPSSSA